MEGLAPVALGLGVDPATKSCTGPNPSPPAPPPPPRPPVPAGGCSALMPGLSLVFGDKTSIASHPKTDTALACLALCKGAANCSYGTWHDNKQGKYANVCLLRSDNQFLEHRQDGHTSFLCNHTGGLPRVADPLPGTIGWAPEIRRLDQQPPRHRGWRQTVSEISFAKLKLNEKALYVDATKGSDSNV